MTLPPLISETEKVVSSVEEFTQAVKAIERIASERDQIVCWRGQANHEWPLMSSLVRAISASVPPDNTIIEALEKKILAEADSWITEFGESVQFKEDVSRLIYLQHHGVPTRLLDFTQDPLVGLFFAAENLDTVDGRVFAILYPKKGVLKKAPNLSDIAKLKQADLRFWQPEKLEDEFPRIRAQKGILAIGKLPTAAFRQQITDSLTGTKRFLLAEEIRRCTSIAAKFYSMDDLQNEHPDMMSGKPDYPAQAVSLRIHVYKPSIRARLERKRGGTAIAGLREGGLSHKVLYPDVSGLQQHSPTLHQLRKGVIIT